jgi:hypothetical protein
MKNKSIYVLLLSVLLLSQTAIAQHDIEHQTFDHTGLCAAFVTADQAADCDLPLVTLVLSAALDANFSLASIELFATEPSTYLSRAPPLV